MNATPETTSTDATATPAVTAPPERPTTVHALPQWTYEATPDTTRRREDLAALLSDIDALVAQAMERARIVAPYDTLWSAMLAVVDGSIREAATLEEVAEVQKRISDEVWAGTRPLHGAPPPPDGLAALIRALRVKMVMLARRHARVLGLYSSAGQWMPLVVGQRGRGDVINSIQGLSWLLLLAFLFRSMNTPMMSPIRWPMDLIADAAAIRRPLPDSFAPAPTVAGGAGYQEAVADWLDDVPL